MSTTMQKQTFLTTVRATGDQPSILISTPGEDRDGDQLDMRGCVLDNYRKNPTVLFAHDYSELPVGVTTSINVTPEGIRASWNWLTGDPMADRVKNAWDQRALNAASVGFRPLESSPRSGGGLLFSKWELLEWSLVPVPSNPEAVRTLKSCGLWSKATAKAGRVLSQINERHIREALGHTQTCSDHLCEVLRALDGDEHQIVLDVDDDTPASKRWPVIRPDDFEEVIDTGPDDEHDDEIDVDPDDVKAALREVLPDLMRDARRQQIAAGVVIELDQSAARHRLREGQLAAVRAAVPELVAREIRRMRGRLD